MKETYADYIIVNVSNYVVTNNKTGGKLRVSELKCLPRDFKKSLSVGNEETIEKYLFSPVLPFKYVDRELLWGAGILCKIDELGSMDVCVEVGADTDFYVRCLNFARLIDLYKGEMKLDKDRQIIDFVAKKLSSMLAERLLRLYANTKNLALISVAQNSLVKLNKRVMSLDNLELFVLDFQNYEKEFKEQLREKRQSSRGL